MYGYRRKVSRSLCVPFNVLEIAIVTTWHSWFSRSVTLSTLMTVPIKTRSEVARTHSVLSAMTISAWVLADTRNMNVHPNQAANADVLFILGLLSKSYSPIGTR